MKRMSSDNVINWLIENCKDSLANDPEVVFNNPEDWTAIAVDPRMGMMMRLTEFMPQLMVGKIGCDSNAQLYFAELEHLIDPNNKRTIELSQSLQIKDYVHLWKSSSGFDQVMYKVLFIELGDAEQAIQGLFEDYYQGYQKMILERTGSVRELIFERIPNLI